MEESPLPPGAGPLSGGAGPGQALAARMGLAVTPGRRGPSPGPVGRADCTWESDGSAGRFRVFRRIPRFS